MPDRGEPRRGGGADRLAPGGARGVEAGAPGGEIGRASGRGRGEISGGAGSLKKKKEQRGEGGVLETDMKQVCGGHRPEYEMFQGSRSTGGRRGEPQSGVEAPRRAPDSGRGESR